MVSNLQQLPGVVRLDPASERSELTVTFNADQTSAEVIVAQLEEWGEEVTDWAVISVGFQNE